MKDVYKVNTNNNVANCNFNFKFIDFRLYIHYNSFNSKHSIFKNSYIPWIWQGVSSGSRKFSTMSDIGIG